MPSRVPIPTEVWKGLEAVRVSGTTNMLDVATVELLALEMGFPETAAWVHEHRDLYAQGVFRGFEARDAVGTDTTHPSADAARQEPAGLLRLFVYGTLKRGCLNHRRFCRGALSIEEAAVRGRLHRLPSGVPIIDVPARDIIAVGSDDIAHDLMVQEEAALPADAPDDQNSWPEVRGELMTFVDPERRLPAIDGLEGFTPGLPCLYRRVLLPVHLPDGRALSAWCYVLGLPKHGLSIP